MEINANNIDLDKLSIVELNELADKIESQQQHWKVFADGSYECGLAHMGYSKVVRKIRELEEQG